MASSSRRFAILRMPAASLWFCESQCHKAVDFSLEAHNSPQSKFIYINLLNL